LESEEPRKPPQWHLDFEPEFDDFESNDAAGDRE
jgi:hypothetical protein